MLQCIEAILAGQNLKAITIIGSPPMKAIMTASAIQGRLRTDESGHFYTVTSGGPILCVGWGALRLCTNTVTMESVVGCYVARSVKYNISYTDKFSLIVWFSWQDRKPILFWFRVYCIPLSEQYRSPPGFIYPTMSTKNREALTMHASLPVRAHSSNGTVTVEHRIHFYPSHC